MKASNLLMINNSYIFSGVGTWNKILQKHISLKISAFFWAAKHIQTYFSYSAPIPAGCQAPSLIRAMPLTPLPERHLFRILRMNVQKAPATAVLHKNVMMQVHREENTGDCSPKSDTEQYTLNFIKPTKEMQKPPPKNSSSSMCFICNHIKFCWKRDFQISGFLLHAHLTLVLAPDRRKLYTRL